MGLQLRGMANREKPNKVTSMIFYDAGSRQLS
jgi:hypothetical protein